MSITKKFLQDLRKEIEEHPGVNHPLLARLSHVPFTREDYKVMGLQHYPLVGTFTTYMEHLLVRSPNSNAKQWLAKVLVDEYGEGTEDKDHAECYLTFLRATGVKKGEEEQTTYHPSVSGFIAEHLRITTQEPFLVGLGALGPGHEWSIPKMFPHIVRGLRRAGLKEDEIYYFTVHLEQDQEHGAWLEESMVEFCQTEENRRQLRRGALLSLAARAKFWSGVQDRIVRWRQPTNMHSRTKARWWNSDSRELTLPDIVRMRKESIGQIRL